MMDAAEAGRASYRRIADRAARLYAPAIHSLAFLAFLGWIIVSGDAHRAITIAIAVLIVTCPCALGLAVPMVHVVAARRLFELGIMVRDGSAIERLAAIDTVVFDKTGTLTTARPRLAAQGDTAADNLALVAAMAMHSRHPYSQALAGLSNGHPQIEFDAMAEHPGKGLEARRGANVYRMGRPDWAIADGRRLEIDRDATVALAINGKGTTYFRFDEDLREGAREAIAELTRTEIWAEVLSGDGDRQVEAVAARFGLPWNAEAQPAEKIEHISALRRAGRKVLMVGDGLNDAPALTAANVSMAPGSASDIGRNAADFVLLRDSLDAVPKAIAVSRAARALVWQNFVLAVVYNVVAIPFAILGHLTPLLAAIAMSLSSVTVIANALRLDGRAIRPERLQAASEIDAPISAGAGK